MATARGRPEKIEEQTVGAIVQWLHRRPDYDHVDAAAVRNILDRHKCARMGLSECLVVCMDDLNGDKHLSEYALCLMDSGFEDKCKFIATNTANSELATQLLADLSARVSNMAWTSKNTNMRRQSDLVNSILHELHYIVHGMDFLDEAFAEEKEEEDDRRTLALRHAKNEAKARRALALM